MGALRSAKEETPAGAGHWRELASFLPSVCPHMYLERESWCRMHSPHCKSPKAGHWSGERTFYCKLLDVSPSFLCGLLQIGPDLGTYLLPCVEPSVEWLFCTGSQRILLPAPIMLTGC